jgi:hypothetical protein
MSVGISGPNKKPRTAGRPGLKFEDVKCQLCAKPGAAAGLAVVIRSTALSLCPAR